jgi:molecular chaperone GrpE (heat shock protein)
VIKNILTVLDTIDEVRNAITDEKEKNSPVSEIRKIFETVLKVKNILETKGSALLDPQN